eukprot:248328-Prymnesium_polylepis.1
MQSAPTPNVLTAPYTLVGGAARAQFTDGGGAALLSARPDGPSKSLLSLLLAAPSASRLVTRLRVGKTEAPHARVVIVQSSTLL